MKTDIEIAQECKMMHIRDVAAKIGIDEDDLEFYRRPGGHRLGPCKRYALALGRLRPERALEVADLCVFRHVDQDLPRLYENAAVDDLFICLDGT